jgi:hypothetical protein
MYFSSKAFADSVLIHIELADSAKACLSVYNRWGQVVGRPMDTTFLTKGHYQFIFYGDTLEVGVYVVACWIENRKQLASTITKDTSTNVLNSKFTEIKIYPNPSKGNISIPIEGFKEIQIYNIEGQLCKSLNTLEESIDVSALSDGVYFTTIRDRQKKVYQGKFIVIR